MGRAAAACLAREGARIVVLARTRSDLDETVEHLSDLGSPEAFGLATDVTDAARVSRGLAKIGDRWNEANILINATGPTAIGSFDDLTQ